MSLTPDILLHGYSIGIFPMAEHRDDPDIFWVDPKRRGILPLDGFHISRSLAKRMRNTKLRVSVDQDFLGVVDGCADRIDTWINAEIRSLYLALYERGNAHSIEVWDDTELVGGVYGVTLGAAFFGESMFSRRTDASKIALACLSQMLARGGFELFDTQFISEDDLKKKNFTLINFFASWCAPCRTEHKYLLKLSRERKEIKIIGVNFKDKKSNAINFLEELGNPYSFVGKDSEGRISILFGIYGIPESILVDSNLTVIKKIVGPIDQIQYDGILKLTQ